MNNKPLAIVRKEVYQELVSSINSIINKTGVPFFVLAPIFKDLFEEINANTEKEYEAALKQYNAQLQTLMTMGETAAMPPIPLEISEPIVEENPTTEPVIETKEAE